MDCAKRFDGFRPTSTRLYFDERFGMGRGGGDGLELELGFGGGNAQTQPDDAK